MLELLGLLAALAFGLVVFYLPPAVCIWRYVLEPEWKNARPYFWGLCAWTALLGLLVLLSPHESGKTVVIVLLAWMIWFWGDLIKTRA